jgi:ketosteroid isomerase-like protein
MTVTNEALAQLLEERAVERLLDRWSIAMDRNDWDAVEACLASEFTLLVPPVVTYADPKPRAQAIREIAARNSKVGGFHSMPAKLVTVEGDRAHATTRLIGGHWSHDKTNWEMAYGFYEVDLVRETGSWRIARLSVQTLFSQGTGLFKQMAQSDEK